METWLPQGGEKKSGSILFGQTGQEMTLLSRYKEKLRKFLILLEKEQLHDRRPDLLLHLAELESNLCCYCGGIDHLYL